MHLTECISQYTLQIRRERFHCVNVDEKESTFFGFNEFLFKFHVLCNITHQKNVAVSKLNTEVSSNFIIDFLDISFLHNNYYFQIHIFFTYWYNNNDFVFILQLIIGNPGFKHR